MRGENDKVGPLFCVFHNEKFKIKSELQVFYPANFLWKSRVPSKVRAFVWLVVLKKVNINDMLQLRRSFKVLNPDCCILCWRSSEMIDHLFLYYPIILGLCNRISSQGGMEWVPLGSICDTMVWSPSSVLGIQLEVGFFRGSRVSLCCGLCRDSRERNALIF